MLPRHHPGRIRIAFDDHHLVANARLLLPATLARRLGLSQLVDRRLDLGHAPGRANTGVKMMTLVASALAGGDCIDDQGVVRTGGTASALGGTVKAPSTLGTFTRSFRWGHVRQLDRVSRELLARAWVAGSGPGDAPFTIDLDHLRDLRPGQGGGAPPWLHRCPGLSPARRAASPCIFPGAGPGKPSSLAPRPDCEPFPSQPDGSCPGRLTLTHEPPKHSPSPRARPASERFLPRHVPR